MPGTFKKEYNLKRMEDFKNKWNLQSCQIHYLSRNINWVDLAIERRDKKKINEPKDISMEIVQRMH
jgi:hypothetical protein